MKKLYFISILAQEVQYQSTRNSRIPIFNMGHWLLGDLMPSHCLGFDLVLVFGHWLCSSLLSNQNMQVTGSLSLLILVPNLAFPINNPSLPLLAISHTADPPGIAPSQCPSSPPSSQKVFHLKMPVQNVSIFQRPTELLLLRPRSWKICFLNNPFVTPQVCTLWTWPVCTIISILCLSVLFLIS